MTAPSAGRDDTTVRGAVVLVVAIVIGLALLARSTSGGSDASADTTGPATSSTEFDGSTSVPDSTVVPVDPSTTSTETTEGSTDTRPTADVKIIVLNGTSADVPGAAADSESILAQAGYQTIDATSASTDLSTTTVYAAPEFAADAEAIKNLLGIGTATVAVRPEESLNVAGADTDADVVVVIGDDAAG